MNSRQAGVGGFALSVLTIIFMRISFTSVYKFKTVHASYARSLQVAVEDIGQAAGNCMVLSRHIHRNGLCIATPGFLLFHSQALEKLLFRCLMIFCDIPWRKFTLQLLLLVELLHLPWKKEKRATYLHSISHCRALLH